MSEFKNNLKDLINKGIDAIGNTASNLAANTRQKVNELALQGKQSEILESFGRKVYEAWKNGAELPEELAADLQEIQSLEEELIQAKDAGSNAEAITEPECSSETETPDQNAAPDYSDIPTIEMPRTEEVNCQKETPLSDEIDQLFSEPPQMEEMADRINTSLDEMGKQLLRFSNEFGKKLSDMADELMNGSEGKDD